MEGWERGSPDKPVREKTKGWEKLTVATNEVE